MVPNHAPNGGMESPIGRRAHQPSPFAKIAAKAQLAGFPITTTGIPFFVVTVFAVVVQVSVLAARKKDVQRKLIVLGAHFFQHGFTVAASLPLDFARNDKVQVHATRSDGDVPSPSFAPKAFEVALTFCVVQSGFA